MAAQDYYNPPSQTARKDGETEALFDAMDRLRVVLEIAWIASVLTRAERRKIYEMLKMNLHNRIVIL